MVRMEYGTRPPVREHLQDKQHGQNRMKWIVVRLSARCLDKLIVSTEVCTSRDLLIPACLAVLKVRKRDRLELHIHICTCRAPIFPYSSHISRCIHLVQLPWLHAPLQRAYAHPGSINSCLYGPKRVCTQSGECKNICAYEKINKKGSRNFKKKYHRYPETDCFLCAIVLYLSWEKN